MMTMNASQVPIDLMKTNCDRIAHISNVNSLSQRDKKNGQ